MCDSSHAITPQTSGDTGFSDCDRVLSNGCEADLTAPATCGSCNLDCTKLPNVAAANCTLGVCSVFSCVDLFKNCNGLTSDGCEVNTGTNILHCGACNSPCNLANVSIHDCSDGR